MSGAASGQGIGGGLLPELLQLEATDPLQQWTNALQGAAALLADAVVTDPIVPDVNIPTMLNAALPRQAVVSEATTAEALARHPAGLTDPTPVLDQMAPIDASVAGQDVGSGNLRSPFTQSAALPSQLAAVLRAAGYTASMPANVAPVARPAPAQTSGTAGSATSPIAGSARPVAQQTATAEGSPVAGSRTATMLSTPTIAPAIAQRTAIPTMGSDATTQPSPIGPESHRAGGSGHATIAQPGLPVGAQPALAAATLSAFDPTSAAGRVERWSRNGSSGADHDMVSYSERRFVPIDLAPVAKETPIARLDDTRALVTVEAGGASAAGLRAAALYRSLMVQRAGLSVLRPGEGFATWDGSPLWLSLAGIRKPPALGVLTVAIPGRVQVMRAADGVWLVEHADGPWRVPSAHHHDATADDDQSLSWDVLYGITTPVPDRFDTAITALRFVARLAGPDGARAQEAWAMVARACALVPRDAQERALHASVSIVLDGRVSPAPADLRTIPPLDRGRFVTLALSGDPARIASGLLGLGRAAIGQIRRGRFDGIGPLEALALAVCLGRLTRGPAAAPPANVPCSQRVYMERQQ